MSPEQLARAVRLLTLAGIILATGSVLGLLIALIVAVVTQGGCCA